MDPIAIVGLDCIFPASDGLAAFWSLLVEGRDAIGLVPAQRWDRDAYHGSAGEPAKIASQWGGFVEGLDHFDAGFFGIPWQEAETLDPQHKLLLEVAYRALENAGLPSKSLAGTQTGVFVGIGHCDHELKLKRVPTRIDANLGVHTYRCFAANRLSYHFNLQGPSLAVDTACSSSLAAVHLACQSLSCGESDLALAGGVNAHLGPEESIASTKMGLLSPDGRCRSFAEDGAGHARSEGCGVVVLKRLRDALEQGDPIWAVIRGSAVNHNGASNGITAPNGPAQARVIRRALAVAEVEAAELGYVEAHATGTPVGERVELTALQEVWSSQGADARRGSEACAPCLLGSLKSNLGHLEAAAGVAGLIKTVLALQHQLIPRSLYSERPHPGLELGAQFRLVSENVPWPRRPGQRRLAGVSAFGFGGSNAHLVLEEAPACRAVRRAAPRSSELLILSAKTELALRRLRESTAARLRAEGDALLPDLCFSLCTGRTPFAFRCALVGSGAAQLAAQLDRAGVVPVEGVQLCSGRAARVLRIALVSGPTGPVSPRMVSSLRAAWPEASAQALTRAEGFAAQLSDSRQRERLLTECFLIECLLSWGVAPTWFLACDEVAGWSAAYARLRVAGLESVGPLAPGLHELRSLSVGHLEGVAGAQGLPGGVRCVALSAGQQGALEVPVLTPFADPDQLWPALLEVLGQLWVEGLNVNWARFEQEQGRTRVLAPNYPFDRRKSWFAEGAVR